MKSPLLSSLPLSQSARGARQCRTVAEAALLSHLSKCPRSRYSPRIAPSLLQPTVHGAAAVAIRALKVPSWGSESRQATGKTCARVALLVEVYGRVVVEFEASGGLWVHT